MKGCIHSLSDRGVRYSTWRSSRQCGRWQFVQKNRTVVASATYVSELDDLGPEYEAPHMDPVEDPMKKILEEFGLEVNTLFRDAHKYDMEQLEAGWDEEAGMYDWEKPVESTELCVAAPSVNLAEHTCRNELPQFQRSTVPVQHKHGMRWLLTSHV